MNPDRNSKRWRIKWRLISSTIVTLLLSVIYYFIFSWLFDTPIEHELKKSTEKLSEHIGILQMKYDTLSEVLDNLQDRDSALFGIIFESTPYTAETQPIYDDEYENLSLSSLGDLIVEKVNSVEMRVTVQNNIIDTIWMAFASNPEKMNHIPSIQPINNPDLSLLATSFGTRINPFYKIKFFHEGVDYAVPVGTAVFATADGVVSKVARGGFSSGTSVTIDHGNGYTTFYGFLSRASVRVGNRVRRGDIIAFTGDEGLSYAPHLHYEVRKSGKPLDPLNFMFMEIRHDKINRFRDLASHAMQAFD